jgi:hypothetical protein
MLPKAILTMAITLKLIGNISIANTDSQVLIMGQLYAVVNQLINNSIVLDDKINSIEIFKVKMSSIKQFNREKIKFKGFST